MTQPFQESIEHLPGNDLMSKMILRNPEIIDMIVTTLIGKLSLYIARPTEWSDGSQSDVLNAPSIASDGLPPVLVEIQRHISHKFIDRLVGYSLHVKKEYKVKPVILVFGIGKTCNNITSDFKATEHIFAKQLVCNYWAEKCFIIDSDTIYEDSKELPLQPLLAIGVFLCHQKPSLISMEYKDDEQTEKKSAEKPVITALLDVCNQTNKQFQKMKEVVLAMPDGLLKKRVLAYAEDECFYTDTCKRKYMKRDLPCTSPMPAPLDLPEATLELVHEFETNSNNNNNNTDDILPELDIPKSDMDHAIQFKKSSKPMN
ncbi:hypothetical protein EDC94DRAFT_671696 [Helicostylum pulchrum]|nr:hypothetical protein EDC94DRAFT_671696 [Helicostylum pulchrum]